MQVRGINLFFFQFQCAPTASLGMTYPRVVVCTSSVLCAHMNSAVAATTLLFMQKDRYKLDVDS